MDGGVVRLILAAIAAVMILCVSVSGTDLTIVLLAGIALALIWRGRNNRAEQPAMRLIQHRPRPGRAASHSRRWLASRARPHRRGGPTRRG